MPVELVGAQALEADLSRMAGPGGALDQASQDAAAKLLTQAAATTRAAIPHISGAMAGSVYVKPEAWGAVLSEGDGVVYAGWVDFGGGHGRPYLPSGRYLFPSVADVEAQTEQAFDQAYQAAVDRYRWTNTGTDPGSVHG